MVIHQGTFISLQHKKKATGGVCNNEFFLDEKFELKNGENSDSHFTELAKIRELLSVSFSNFFLGQKKRCMGLNEYAHRS
jgi:hypothetical protein